MNSKIPFVLLCLAFSGTEVYAACENNQRLNQNELKAAFPSKTVSFDCVTDCDQWMAATSVDWHERHDGAIGGDEGDLIEIGTGAGGSQPSEVVGIWRIQGQRIRYTYTGDSTVYRFTVVPIDISGGLGSSGSTYEFCLQGTYKAKGTID